MTQGVFEVIERSGIGAKIGHERMFLNLQAAVEAYERRVTPRAVAAPLRGSETARDASAPSTCAPAAPDRSTPSRPR
jgi:hypothetical protein